MNGGNLFVTVAVEFVCHYQNKLQSITPFFFIANDGRPQKTNGSTSKATITFLIKVCDFLDRAVSNLEIIFKK